MRCCLCGNEFSGYGHNPEPLTDEGRCCNECNENVIKFRALSDIELLKKAHPDYSPKKIRKLYEELRIGVRHMCIMGEKI